MNAKDGVMARLLHNADKFTDRQVAETIDMVVAHGVARGASDIHFEPHDRFVLVRYRIDGTLRGIHKLPRAALGSLMSQLKKRADLNASETRTPQEGAFTTEENGQTIDIRVTTMPVYGGEKAVLHLALRPGKPEALTALGFWGESLRAIETVLGNPHGLVIVAGPRHSGVSSTVFSMLDQLNSPLINIATVETRAKHRLPGVNQTYIAANGMTLLQGVQAALKQDPNILLLGDAPDRATADLAVNAASTGHLVFISLHADSAPAAALRLRATGIEPFMLASTIRACIGQRLVRRLCPYCRERVQLDTLAQHQLDESFGIATAAAHKRVHELEQAAEVAGMGQSGELHSAPTRITHLWQAHEHGCDRCDRTGFQGRTAITEVLSNTTTLQKLLLSPDIVAAPGLQKAVLRDGFIPMGLDGLIKALRGITTVDEVLHAVGVTTSEA